MPWNLCFYWISWILPNTTSSGFTFVRESQSSSSWRKRAVIPLPVLHGTFFLILLHRHPVCSRPSTRAMWLLNVSPLFAGLSGGCDVSDSLHGAPGAAHPLWMGALLDSGQPLPQPLCAQSSLPGLPVSNNTSYL